MYSNTVRFDILTSPERVPTWEMLLVALRKFEEPFKISTRKVPTLYIFNDFNLYLVGLMLQTRQKHMYQFENFVREK